VTGQPGEARERLLDPVERISEILFGLIMAVTIVGSLAIATAGHDEMRAVTIAAIGCNLAWGLVDAVMYLVRLVTVRTRDRAILRQLAASGAEAGRRIVADTLPDHVAAVAGPDDLENMRTRLLALRPDDRPVLTARDWLAALGIFLLVVIATFPVVLPFIFAGDAASAMRASRIITLVMLMLAGYMLGRHAGHARPLLTGVAMTLLGALLVAAVMALGG
jgi:VIT1/CCC1 family predicted Fe2+/Mn2+ transporter